MSIIYRIKNKEFLIYLLPSENYVGVTTDLRPRLNKHRSHSNYNTSDVVILYRTFNLREALTKELEYQHKYKCEVGVRNQEGKKNPYAKTVLHTLTGVYFDTIKEASECFNYSYKNVRKYIGQTNNKYNLIRL